MLLLWLLLVGFAVYMYMYRRLWHTCVRVRWDQPSAMLFLLAEMVCHNISQSDRVYINIFLYEIHTNTSSRFHTFDFFVVPGNFSLECRLFSCTFRIVIFFSSLCNGSSLMWNSFCYVSRRAFRLIVQPLLSIRKVTTKRKQNHSK